MGGALARPRATFFPILQRGDGSGFVLGCERRDVPVRGHAGHSNVSHAPRAGRVPGRPLGLIAQPRSPSSACHAVVLRFCVSRPQNRGGGRVPEAAPQRTQELRLKKTMCWRIRRFTSKRGAGGQGSMRSGGFGTRPWCCFGGCAESHRGPQLKPHRPGKYENGRTPSEEGGLSPPGPPPLKVTTAGKSDVEQGMIQQRKPRWAILVHKLLGPRPPPPPPTKTRSDPQRVRMSCGEGPIGTAKGKQSDTEALCHPPPPHHQSLVPPPPPSSPLFKQNNTKASCQTPPLLILPCPPAPPRDLFDVNRRILQHIVFLSLNSCVRCGAASGTLAPYFEVGKHKNTKTTCFRMPLEGLQRGMPLYKGVGGAEHGDV